MAELKTKPTKVDVASFIASIADEPARVDSQALLNMMQKVTGGKPVMWGLSMVGFGKYHCKYQSGREGDWFIVGFSPRRQNLTLYMLAGFEKYAGLLSRLGKHTTAKSCLTIKRLADVDMDVLKNLIRSAYRDKKKPGI